MSNSLASVHPELISEWSEKNLPLTPDKITFGSNKRVWWIGACGHEWETSVKARSKGEKCPICSGARVIEGIYAKFFCHPVRVASATAVNEPVYDFYNLSRSVISQFGSPPCRIIVPDIYPIIKG